MRTLKSLGGRVVPGRFRFKEPDPGQTFSTLDALLQAVRAYRSANGIPMGDDLQAEVEDWLCRQIDSPERYCREEGNLMPFIIDGGKWYGNGYQGQAKWRELHEWALLQDSPEERRAWMEDFTGSLPCGECRRHWRTLLRDNPAPYGATPPELWHWTFDRHSDIRRRLGQSLMPEEAARAIYFPNP